jgi:hypothetical protein
MAQVSENAQPFSTVHSFEHGQLSNIHVIIRVRPRPLTSRVTADARTAHPAFAHTLGSEAISGGCCEYATWRSMAGRTRLVVPIGAAPAEPKARPFCRPGMRRRRRRRTRVAGVVLGVVAGGRRWSGAHSAEAKGQSDGRRCRVENLGHDETFSSSCSVPPMESTPSSRKRRRVPISPTCVPGSRADRSHQA